MARNASATSGPAPAGNSLDFFFTVGALVWAEATLIEGCLKSASSSALKGTCFASKMCSFARMASNCFSNSCVAMAGNRASRRFKVFVTSFSF